MPFKRQVAVTMMSLGLALLLASTIYYIYIFWFAGSGLENLSASSQYKADTLRNIESMQTSEKPPDSINLIANQGLYPGAFMPARLWADPRGTRDLGHASLAKEFIHLELGQFIAQAGSLRASRIKIPSVDIDASIEELSILTLDESREYETPKFTVGHIPQSSNPGAKGNGWYFGHLESIFSDEGNVFAKLPRIPELMRVGEDVYIILVTEETEYIYLVTKTEVINQKELGLYQTDGSTITLVTCYPRLKYDHRLLVSAGLIGYKMLHTET